MQTCSTPSEEINKNQQCRDSIDLMVEIKCMNDSTHIFKKFCSNSILNAWWIFTWACLSCTRTHTHKPLKCLNSDSFIDCTINVLLFVRLLLLLAPRQILPFQWVSHVLFNFDPFWICHDIFTSLNIAR